MCCVDQSLPLDVLVVEDDADARLELRKILEIDGHRVEVAGSINPLRERQDLSRFHVILLRRQTPGGIGDDLLPYLRERAPSSALILMTAATDQDGATDALRGGFEDLLTKPIGRDALRFRLAQIAERLRLRRELVQTRQKLVQLERLAAIGQALAAFSHEARNELSGLKLGLQLLPKRLNEGGKALRTIDYLDQCQQRLHRLVEDIRGYAAPLHLNNDHCVLSHIWRAAWKSLKPRWEKRDVTFREELPLEIAGAVLNADAFRLEQVFRNLFENALDACGEPALIDVRVSHTNAHPERVTVCVRDDGPGLTDENKSRIFEPFFTTKSKGTGIGMPIAKRIVEAHGGALYLGDCSAGAEFLIELPLVDVHSPQMLSCMSGDPPCSRGDDAFENRCAAYEGFLETANQFETLTSPE